MLPLFARWSLWCKLSCRNLSSARFALTLLADEYVDMALTAYRPPSTSLENKISYLSKSVVGTKSVGWERGKHAMGPKSAIRRLDTTGGGLIDVQSSRVKSGMQLEGRGSCGGTCWCDTPVLPTMGQC